MHCIKDENIPSALIVNSNQTQLTYAQGCHLTYAEIDLKQISTVRNDEKQALTVFISLTNDDILLPFQAIYKSSSPHSLPSKKSLFYAEAVSAGFLFESSHTDTYWSTQGTMPNFINKILAPYFDQTIEALRLPSDQHCLWQIDCWSVHCLKEFKDWMRVEHPKIVVNFVSACLTSLFQPCDVGFQQVLKLALKQLSHNDVVTEVLD